MGNISNAFQKLAHKNDHEWVRYSNPRNGRIQVTACKQCGTMQVGALSSRPCSKKQIENSLESKGWTILNKEVELANQA